MRFLSCDWGSTSFRLALVESETGEVTASVAEGLGALAASEQEGAYEQTLSSAIGKLGDDLANVPVLLSGMVTSSYGWCEVAYAHTPFALHGRALAFEERRSSGGRRLVFIGGVRTESDVMRGEESQIVGLCHAALDGVPSDDFMLILPGTHSKHVSVRGGAMDNFSTFMTGEVFEVLRQYSVLRKTTADNATFDACAFEQGVATGADKPLLGSLFRVRTNGLFERFGKEANTSFLSGLLIGNEVAELLDADPAMPLVLCAGSLADHYAGAIRQLGAEERLTCIEADTAQRLAHIGHAAFVRAHPEWLRD